jgi:hypothetical protein
MKNASQEQVVAAIQKATRMAQSVKGSIDCYDLFGARSMMADLADLYDCFKDSEAISLTFLEVIMGILGLKYETGDCENLDTYMPDIIEITDRFPDSESIASMGCMCYSNCLQNHIKNGGSMSFVRQLLDYVRKIAGRFPENQEINIVYCRILAICVSISANHPDTDFFEESAFALRKLINLRKFPVDPEIRDMLRRLE